MASHTVNDIPADFKSTLPPRKRAKTQEEKEQRRIERILRNRKAAHQSREKKRLHLMYLEKKCSLLERIMSHVDLEELVERLGDAELRRTVNEYEAVVREGAAVGAGAAGFAVDGDDKVEKEEAENGTGGSGVSAATTPSVKSPSMSGTTPGSPCTTVVGQEDSYFGRRDFMLENSGAKSEARGTDSYSYVGVAGFQPSFAAVDEAGPRVFSGNKANSESWNLLLTQPHSCPLSSNNIFKDDMNEPFEMTDSSMDLDHWRNPAVVVQWKK